MMCNISSINPIFKSIGFNDHRMIIRVIANIMNTAISELINALYAIGQTFIKIAQRKVLKNIFIS